MDASILKKRTQQFGLRIIKLVETLPQTPVTRVIGNQLLRSGTSVGANYRAACRGRSKAEFASKIGIVIEEADESLYWMEMLSEAKIILESKLSELMQEANEIIAIMSASVKTVRKNQSRK